MFSSDEHIIKSVLDGKVNDFRYLVQKYEVPLMGLCMRLTQNEEKAKELLQDAFIEIYKHLASYKFKAKFSTWAYTITYRTVAKFYKSKKENQMIVWMNEIEESANEEEQEERKDIQINLDALNPVQRNLIQWFYYENMSIAEIAEITGFTTSKIKTNLHRTREKLAVELKKIKDE